MSVERTDRWGFAILGPGDTVADDGYKFSDADRRLMDRLLRYATEDHHHTGEAGVDNTPVGTPMLTLETTGGGMASGIRYYYKITVIDESGNESAGTAAAFLDTPGAVAVPGAPTLSVTYGTGTLAPGTYTYILSAYKDTSLLESKATNSAVISVSSTAADGEVTLDLPSLPAGASGFNVYRKSPTGMHFLWLGSTILDTFVDDGTTDGDCDRSLPAKNRTSSSNLIVVAYPGATPAIPDGWSWRIYRTNDPTSWDNSLLAQINPELGVTPVTYDDVGSATDTGAPPTASQVINAPPRIQLTDAAEVDGELPPGRVTFPHIVTFRIPGLVEVQEWPEQWVCDYDDAFIISCRANLGVDSPPVSDDVIVDVNVYRVNEATPTWQSIYEDGPLRPTVPIGEIIGEPTEPIIQRLYLGDILTIDVDQAGGGATPTDAYLSVNVLMVARQGSLGESWEWTDVP